MNVSLILSTNYENIANWTLGENKPNSNPIKPNPQKAKMNVNLTLTKDYRKKDCLAPQKTNPIQTQSRNNSRAKGALGGLENLLIGKLVN